MVWLVRYPESCWPCGVKNFFSLHVNHVNVMLRLEMQVKFFMAGPHIAWNKKKKPCRKNFLVQAPPANAEKASLGVMFRMRIAKNVQAYKPFGGWLSRARACQSPAHAGSRSVPLWAWLSVSVKPTGRGGYVQSIGGVLETAILEPASLEAILVTV